MLLGTFAKLLENDIFGEGGDGLVGGRIKSISLFSNSIGSKIISCKDVGCRMQFANKISRFVVNL